MAARAKAPARKKPPAKKNAPARKITVPDFEPGIHLGVSEAVYDRIPAIRSSLLKTVRDSTCRHAREQVVNPKSSSSFMNLGSAIHIAALEGLDEFEKRVVVGPDHDRKSNENYNKWVDFETAHYDQYILKPGEMERLKHCVEAVVAHPGIRHVLFETKGVNEATLIWDDPETGLRCKARPDRLANWNRRQCMFDVKSFGRVPTKEAIKRRVGELGYDLAAGHYMNGATVLAPSERRYYWIWIETVAPFTVRMTKPGMIGLQDGQYKAHLALKKWAKAVGEDVYPAWGDDIEETDPMKWHALTDEELDEEGGY